MISRTKTVASTSALIGALAFFLFPIYWMISTAFKTRPNIFSFPPRYFFFSPTLGNFSNLIGGNRAFTATIWNSVIIASGSTVLALVVGTTAAYVLSRWKFKRNDDVSFYVLSTRMMPPIVVIIPMFMIFRELRLLNSHWAVIIAHMVFSLPLVTWMMKSFFDEIPVEIEESARVDGCSVPRLLAYISIPLASPGIISSGIFAFIFSWNEFLFALILTGFETRTVPIALIGFQSSIGVRWGEMAAGGTLAIVPVLLFTLCVQNFLIRGLTSGAVKD